MGSILLARVRTIHLTSTFTLHFPSLSIQLANITAKLPRWQSAYSQLREREREKKERGREMPRDIQKWKNSIPLSQDGNNTGLRHVPRTAQDMRHVKYIVLNEKKNGKG